MKMIRKTRASSLNNEKQKITEAINNRFKEFENLEINQKLQKNKVDVTLPAERGQMEKFILSHKLLMRFLLYFSEIGFFCSGRTRCRK